MRRRNSMLSDPTTVTVNKDPGMTPTPGPMVPPKIAKQFSNEDVPRQAVANGSLSALKVTSSAENIEFKNDGLPRVANWISSFEAETLYGKWNEESQQHTKTAPISL